MGDRWSKPHVPTAKMHALLELRKAFAEGRCATGLGVTPSKKGQYQIAGKQLHQRVSSITLVYCKVILRRYIKFLYT